MKKNRTKKETDNLYILAKEDYITNKISIIAASKKYDISPLCFSRFLDKENVQKRTNTEFYKKYNLNETFFDIIDTEEKAYILGFLFADGYINNKNKIIILALTEKDKDILLKINNIVGSDKPLQYIKPSEKRYSKLGQYRLCFQSKYMHDCFVKNNFLNRSIIPKIDDNLIRHFIRGIFDGDGCCSTGWRKNKHYRYFNGTFEILFNDKSVAEEINKIISSNSNISLLSVKNKKGNGSTIVFQIKWSGIDNIINIYNYLYKDATIYLERKCDKFKELISMNCRSK